MRDYNEVQLPLLLRVAPTERFRLPGSDDPHRTGLGESGPHSRTLQVRFQRL